MSKTVAYIFVILFNSIYFWHNVSDFTLFAKQSKTIVKSRIKRMNKLNKRNYPLHQKVSQGVIFDKLVSPSGGSWAQKKNKIIYLSRIH